MDLQTVITKGQNELLPLAELRELAANRHAFGDDVVAMLNRQRDLRHDDAQTLIVASRERELKASEQRQVDAALNEAQLVAALRAEVEQRTAARNFVPATQTTKADTRTVFSADEFRALVTGSGSGQYVAPDEFASTFFDKLSTESIALRSGIRVITTDRDVLRVPTITADPTAAWTSEGSQISAADPTYVEKTGTPRKLAALTIVSNELVMDSNPSVLEMLQMQLARSLALKLDLTFFEGSGTSPEPYGLKNVSGISTAGAFGGTGTAAGGATNLDHIATAISQLEQDNAKATAIAMHPRTWGQMLKLKDATSGSNKPLLLQDTNPTNGVVRSVYGVPVFLSSQLSTTETVSTSTDCSSIYVYEAPQIVMVRRMDLRIEIDRSMKFDYDQTVIKATMRVDFVHPNAKAIDRISGIRA